MAPVHGDDLMPPGRFGFEPKLPHQSANFINADQMALVAQFFHDPHGTVLLRCALKMACIRAFRAVSSGSFSGPWLMRLRY